LRHDRRLAATSGRDDEQKTKVKVKKGGIKGLGFRAEVITLKLESIKGSGFRAEVITLELESIKG
jgi:hypothetical protein